MKKIFAIAALTVLGYGFTFSTRCKTKDNACSEVKEEAVIMAPAADLSEEEQINFHPLIFISDSFQ